MIIRRVLELVEVLKKRSVRVSRAEVEDALRALDVIAADAFVDRALFAAVLQATLIKNSADIDVFVSSFALCFGADAESSSSLPLSSLSRQQAEQAFGAGLGGGDPVRAGLVQSLIDGDEAGVRLSLRQGLDELDLAGLASPLQAGWYASRLLLRLGLDELFAGANDAVDDELRPALQALEDRLRRGARRLIEQEEQKRSGRTSTSAAGTWDSDLRTLNERQTEEARVLLRKLAERLRARVLRRRKKSRRGRLDVRRTLRRSLRTDGIPVVPVLRRRRVEKPALLLLCDVSDSVRASALFLLELCAVLHDLFDSTRAYVFVDHLHDVTALLASQGKPGGASAIASSEAVMGGGNSDYGQALHDIDVDAVTRKTVVVVLGDGRSNYRDPGLDVAATLKLRAKSVVWLVPEDRGTWGFGDSVIPRFSRHADAMLPARTLRNLARAIDRVLR